ncbi:54S ribosomal protein L4, mitochondrial [Xylariales sp. AK1849]|nr:54S ribosomal protein L4, mitochondrial [Xylariales sp. AK1849]
MASLTSIRPAIGRILQQTNRGSSSTSLYLPVLVSRQTSSPFSTTPTLSERKPRRDNNRLRGLSSLYRSGTKARMAVDGFEVPQPAKYKPEDDTKTDPEHGLWEFFYEKDEALIPPEEESQHGRSWTVEELRHKSWGDLHRLWWVCVKERNRVATASRERKRLGFQTGKEQSAERMKMVSKTMKAIRHALTERYYTWEDARTLAATDPEVDLSSQANPYTPHDFLEEEMADSEVYETEAEAAEEEKQLLEQPVVETIDPSTLPKTPENQPTARP